MAQQKLLSIRLPEDALAEIEEIAQITYIPTRSMIRQWLMQRLEKERREIGTACEILQKHAEDLSEDPERLSTEFLKDVIGVECDSKSPTPQ